MELIKLKNINTLKELEKVLILFEKEKETTKEIKIQNMIFQIKKEKNGFYNFENENRSFELKLVNEATEHLIIKTSKDETIREIEKEIGKFIDGKQLWRITETVNNIKRFSFICLINPISEEDFQNILGFSKFSKQD